ncbi:hypothetical protein IAU60_002162 [Kwoniella sp. DSM 27419]
MSSSPFPSGAEKPVCVFCGSSPGKLPLYTKASEAVGQALAQANIPLVYGGGRRGIMGVVSQAALKAGGLAHGIVPRALTVRASQTTLAPGIPADPSMDVQSKEGSGEAILNDDFEGRLTTDVVESMHERKTKMAEMSQGGFIVLPGGYGTFEEALEMTTWNQLGIHRLPILILNIGNFYSHMEAQFQAAVEAGFIAPANLSLCKIVNLDGGEAANRDESKASEWGPAAIKALREWSLEDGTGYGLNWDLKEKRAGGAAQLPNGTNQTQLHSTSSLHPPEAIFTTLRYTSPHPHEVTLPVEERSLPLLDLHIERLREAHAHFAGRSDHHRQYWGGWMGDGVIRNALMYKLEETERAGPGDWRVRVVIHPGPRVEVQALPAPKDAGPFTMLPAESSSKRRRPLLFDPQVTQLSSDSSDSIDLRLYKTTSRDMYDAAYSRGGELAPTLHPEVLLHTPTHVLETSTSNIAILAAGSQKWITSRLSASAPFLNGVMRRYLLSLDIMEEGDISPDLLRQVWRDGGRIIGFNGLRGVWEAELVES